jgi:hypothetical protein
MPRPPHSLIHRTQCELARRGELGCAIGSREAFHKACRALGQRGAAQRTRLRHLTLPNPATQGRSCLPPGDRD